MDREAKDLWHKAIKQLEGLNETLESLLKAANRPRQHNEEAAKEIDSRINSGDSSTGESFFSLYFWPRPKHAHNPKTKWYKTLAGCKSFVETLAFIAAMIYAGIAYMQWRDANENFRNDERAWISITEISGAPEVGKPWVVTIIIRNSGKTVARNVFTRIGGDFERFDGEPPIRYSSENPFVSKGVISPLSTAIAHGYPGSSSSFPKPDMPKAMFDGVMDGSYKSAVFVTITYDDIFGGHHQTTSCSIFRPSMNNFTPCEKGNDAD